MDPRVTRHEKRLDLSYDLPHRIRCSAVYPIPAPNESTVILYGTDDGLRVLWRGGRRIKIPQSAQAKKPSSSEVIVLDDSEDDVPTQAESELKAGYENEEDDIDEEDPYASITHDIVLPTANAVTEIAVPVVSSQWPLNTPEEALEEAVIVIATTSGAVLLVRVPLSPLATFDSPARAQEIISEATELCGEGPFVRGLTIRFFEHTQNAACVAAITDFLELWRLELDGLPDSVQPLTIALEHTPSTVSFHPTSRQPLLLLSDITNTCRIFEPSSKWQSKSEVNDPYAQGTWLADLHAPFAAISTSSTSLPLRKRILDAQWVLNGRCVFMVFDDGAWGIWDTTALYSSEKALDDPVVSGYLDSAALTESADTAPPKRAGPLLAPMTPNTRKTKGTTLFSAPQSKATSGTSRGGITVSRAGSTVGSADECVIIWVRDNVYTIPSIQTFWQRSTSGSGGFGSLYAPGIAHLQALELFHECVSSISQLPSKVNLTNSTKITKAPDLVLSAESRLIIVQHKATRDFLHSNEKHTVHAELQDQRMLDAGELDISGMDRILSTMTGADARPRRVGFAH